MSTPSTSTRRRPMGPTSPTSTDRSTWCNSRTGPPAPTGSTPTTSTGREPTCTSSPTRSLGRYLFLTGSERPTGSALSASTARGFLRARWEVRLRAFCGCRGKQRPDLPAGDDLVDGSVLDGLLGGQDEVAVGVLGHALD